MNETQTDATNPVEQNNQETRIQKRNRKDIINAAIDLIAESGFEGARMEAISARAGVTRTNINYYFRTREDLHRAVLKHVLDVWEEVWMDALEGEGTPQELLRRYIAGKLRASWEQPKLSRVFAAEVLRGAPIVSGYIVNEMRPTFEKACSTLAEWMDEGHLRKSSPEHIFITIWGATQYYADFNVVTTLIMKKETLSESDFEEALSTITSIIIGGLLPDN